MTTYILEWVACILIDAYLLGRLKPSEDEAFIFAIAGMILVAPVVLIVLLAVFCFRHGLRQDNG